MKPIKIDFVDFWPSFHKKDNYFFHLLSQRFNVFIDTTDPDVVFGSYDFNQKREILKYDNHRSLKVYYTGESDEPRGYPYNIQFTQRRGLERSDHMRIPLWVFFCSWFGENNHVLSRDPSYLVPYVGLDKSKIDLEAIYDSKKRFCNFIYADETAERIKWFDAISQIGKVDSAGKLRNNIGGSITGRGDQIYKQIFMSEYLFSLAIENRGIDGYATEKLLHPMSVISIPIYWGDPNIHLDINVDSIIDLRNKNIKEIQEEVFYLMSDKNRYLDKLSKPWFAIDHRQQYLNNVLDFIEQAINKIQK
jgi:hypothetical protein